ncbi:Uncharacterized protein FWK35_00009789 [Aphis craccivora]|uniref:Uncharacterized protein n=1 Tax=Aphis craccivora TaxID=307492 RepID=A0A6G0ZIF2_APHCR|nr:Uncharacterized protein FWK35_00009789 [Aphis craccivora]
MILKRQGWHRAFSPLLAASHPTIWRLIVVLKREQHLTDIKINQFIAGQEPTAKKKKYRDVARRIENIVSIVYDNINTYWTGKWERGNGRQGSDDESKIYGEVGHTRYCCNVPT